MNYFKKATLSLACLCVVGLLSLSAEAIRPPGHSSNTTLRNDTGTDVVPSVTIVYNGTSNIDPLPPPIIDPPLPPVQLSWWEAFLNLLGLGSK